MVWDSWSPLEGKKIRVVHAKLEKAGPVYILTKDVDYKVIKNKPVKCLEVLEEPLKSEDGK